MTIRVVVHHALEQITLDVDLLMDGGLTALLGPSGGGKTRTLEVIAGLLRPDSGLVVVDGEVLTDTEHNIWIAPHLRRIGYVFQDSRLFPHLTVRQNLAFGHWFNRRRGAGATLDDVVALLTQPGAIFQAAPVRTMVYAEYMHQVGFIKTKPASWKDYFHPLLHAREPRVVPRLRPHPQHASREAQRQAQRQAGQQQHDLHAPSMAVATDRAAS